MEVWKNLGRSLSYHIYHYILFFGVTEKSQSLSERTSVMSSSVNQSVTWSAAKPQTKTRTHICTHVPCDWPLPKVSRDRHQLTCDPNEDKRWRNLALMDDLESSVDLTNIWEALSSWKGTTPVKIWRLSRMTNVALVGLQFHVLFGSSLLFH